MVLKGFRNTLPFEFGCVWCLYLAVLCSRLSLTMSLFKKFHALNPWIQMTFLLTVNRDMQIHLVFIS